LNIIRCTGRDLHGINDKARHECNKWIVMCKSLWAIGGRGASRKPLNRWVLKGRGTIIERSKLTKVLWAISIRWKPVNTLY
jgi:hypothetical protein